MQVNPCVKRSREPVTTVTRAFFRNRPIWMYSLDRSHPRSFLEGIELQESGSWPRRRRRRRQRAPSARQAGRPAGRQASRPCRQGLLSVGPTPTFPHPPPAGYPRRIASFKCRKLSSQVRASDFASSFSLLNGDPPHPAIPCLHLETAPSAPRGGRGLGGGEGGRGTDSPRVRPKESPPFGNPGNPAHACEDHGRAWKQPPSLDIFPSVGGGFPPCLPSEGQKRREGQSVPLALAGS